MNYGKAMSTKRRLFRVRYTMTNLLGQEKKWSELWRSDRQPLLDEVTKYWDGLVINHRVSNLVVEECDPMCKSPAIVEV